ncbi:O-methyltransferase [Rhodovulum sp. PH10]|uniref:methyltransferase n=1 Tax=Rhodovulum sp. PH10 TaxID=1187851 RepID=UPI00027C2D99|nr:methyltransferase [Rhodovulum sp. PH10]EJW11074.1 O-methyltransferase [Rhodovulum sp. PH10]
MLEALPEWPAARRLLDLGAGSEVLATTVAARRPDLSVVILDLPEPAGRIKAAVAESEARERISVIAGDYDTVDLGHGYDLIVASMTLYYAKNLVAVPSAEARRGVERDVVDARLPPGTTLGTFDVDAVPMSPKRAGDRTRHRRQQCREGANRLL